MEELTLNTLKLFGMIPEHDEECSALYDHALANLDLEFVDYITIRDLCKISGYCDHALLVLLVCMFESLRNGSICLSLSRDSLKRKISLFYPEKAALYAKKIVETLKQYPQLIHCMQEQDLLFRDPLEEFKPLICETSESGMYLYFQRYYQYEKNFKKLFAVHVGYELQGLPDTESINSALTEVLVHDPLSIGGVPVAFNAEQWAAMILPVYKNCVIISGGPGTGKTSIVVGMLRILNRLGLPTERIRVAAPTGRAAQRMTDAISDGIASLRKKGDGDLSLVQIQGQTIHRLLEYSPTARRFRYSRKNPLDIDCLVIVEVSMVDLVLLSELFDAIKPETRVILLGDHDQLPAVNVGSVLADLVPDQNGAGFSREMLQNLMSLNPDIAGTLRAPTSDRSRLLDDRVVVLKHNFRSEKNIHTCAEAINNQRTSIIQSIPCVTFERSGKAASNFFAEIPGDYVMPSVAKIVPGFSRAPFHQEFRALAYAWIEYHFEHHKDIQTPYRELVARTDVIDVLDESNTDRDTLLGRLFGACRRVNILTPLRTGYVSALVINEYIARMYQKNMKQRGLLFSGLPIVITRNDYQHHLFNGDTGIILARGNDFYAFFNKGGRFISYSIELVSSFEPAYAMTVHKSQGSEFDHVMLVVADATPLSLLNKEIIYTAFTRARKGVVLYASDAILEKGISNPVERESTLSW